MAKLTFNASDIKPLVKHTLESDKRKACWGQKDKIPAGLWLVKDEGIYLMSNGEQVVDSETGRLPVVYAKGYNPHKADVWEKAYAVSSDDFCQFIPVKDFSDFLEWGADTITIKLTATTMQIGASRKPQLAQQTSLNLA